MVDTNVTIWLKFANARGVPRPALTNKNMTASVTASDGDAACATAIAAAPALGGYVGVRVNGVHVQVSNGNKTLDCYFSGDGGTTARATGAIAAGDLLYWVGSVAGYQLDASDKIDFDSEQFF